MSQPNTCTALQGVREATRCVQPGDVFGEVALLTKGPRQADCIAASDKVKVRRGVEG